MISVKEQKEKIIQSAISLISSYIHDYNEIGLFGSVARGVYSASSDVDIYIVTSVAVDKYIKAELTADLEELGVDIIFLTDMDYAVNKDHLLIKNILKDRRVLSKIER